MPYFEPAHGRYSLAKLVIELLIIGSLAGIIISGYYAFTHKSAPIIGVVSFLATVLLFVIFVRISRSPRYRWVRPGFLLVFLPIAGVIVVSAFAGVQPLSDYKDSLFSRISKLESESPPNLASNPSQTTSPEKSSVTRENFLAGLFIIPQVIELNKIQEWKYSSPKQLNFRSVNPPYVVNAWITARTSQVSVELNTMVYKRGDPYKITDIPITSQIKGMSGRQAFIIKEQGDFVIDVQSVGCDWLVMVGHETEGAR